jgi:hypothetical protein
MTIEAIRHAVIAAAAITAWMPLGASAAACHAQSGDRTLALVELYTSEGCDSCPPADRWLSRHVPTGGADAVALAFHVDYWDRLGWTDRFSAPQYTERQHETMRMSGGRFVYTPQVLIGGRDFAQWRSSAPSRAISAINARPPRARIALDAQIVDGRVVGAASASIDDASARRASLAVALVDSGLVSDVKAGENAGARLAHDHVVRRFATGFDARAGSTRAAIDWPLPKEGGRAPTLVAFVQDLSNGDVLQAFAMPLEGCSGR